MRLMNNWIFGLTNCARGRLPLPALVMVRRCRCGMVAVRSQLKEYPYKITGGTGKYEGASGGGTYIYENLTDILSGGTYKGQIVLP
jgi:hypothetical protein